MQQEEKKREIIEGTNKEIQEIEAKIEDIKATTQIGQEIIKIENELLQQIDQKRISKEIKELTKKIRKEDNKIYQSQFSKTGLLLGASYLGGFYEKPEEVYGILGYECYTDEQGISICNPIYDTRTIYNNAYYWLLKLSTGATFKLYDGPTYRLSLSTSCNITFSDEYLGIGADIKLQNTFMLNKHFGLGFYIYVGPEYTIIDSQNIYANYINFSDNFGWLWGLGIGLAFN